MTELQKETLDKVSHFIGMTRNELISVLQVETRAKNINSIVVNKLLTSFAGGSPIDLRSLKEQHITIKTIPVNKKGRVKESMSFAPIDFMSIVSERWEDSSLHRLFAEETFLFFVFKEDMHGDNVLTKVMLWKMPEQDLIEVRAVWEKAVAVIRNGVQTTIDGRYTTNDLPKAKENRVAHVRPHARDSADTLPLPNGSEYIKQSFWLNSSYIADGIGAAEL